MASAPNRWLSTTGVLLILLAVPTYGDPLEDPPEYNFGCGEDEPPSGDYWDLELLQMFRYDCTKLTLEPLAVFDECIYETVENKSSPLAGACFLMNSANDGATDYYTYQLQYAVRGEWPGREIHTWQTDTGATERQCEDSRCGGQGVLTNGIVTFFRMEPAVWSDGSCSAHWSTGEATVTSSLGVDEKLLPPHDVYWCTHQ